MRGGLVSKNGEWLTDGGLFVDYNFLFWANIFGNDRRGHREMIRTLRHGGRLRRDRRTEKDVCDDRNDGNGNDDYWNGLFVTRPPSQ
ncbi:MAG: hypothetical protein IK084_02710 [Bacteroidaceae bacterium]|nr:hypothetical protein [Bacteroidaceae bacterium]